VRYGDTWGLRRRLLAANIARVRGKLAADKNG